MKATDLMIVALTSVHYFMWTATRTLKRWITKEKSYIDISLPDTVLDYNRPVAGVYLADMLIALYRTKIIAQKYKNTLRWFFTHLITARWTGG